MKEPKFGVKTLLGTYVLLMFLLVLTIAVAFINLGPFNTPINIGIAVVKTVFIALFFMELLIARGLVRIAAGAGVYWLAILIGLSLMDYLTRNWASLPGK